MRARCWPLTNQDRIVEIAQKVKTGKYSVRDIERMAKNQDEKKEKAAKGPGRTSLGRQERLPDRDGNCDEHGDGQKGENHPQTARAVPCRSSFGMRKI